MADHKQLLLVVHKNPDFEAGKNIADLHGNDCSCGCVHFHKLDGKEGMDWGVCTEPRSPRSGLLTFEHMGCQFFKGASELSVEDLQTRLRFYESVLSRMLPHHANGRSCKIAEAAGLVCCNPQCNGDWGSGCWCCHAGSFAAEATMSDIASHLAIVKS